MKNPNSSTLETDIHEGVFKDKEVDDGGDDEVDLDGDDDEGDGDDNLMKSRNVEKMALHPHSMNHLKIYGFANILTIIMVIFTIIIIMIILVIILIIIIVNHLKIYGQTVQMSSPSSWSYSPSS